MPPYQNAVFALSCLLMDRPGLLPAHAVSEAVRPGCASEVETVAYPAS